MMRDPKIEGWPKYDGSNECQLCLFVNVCVMNTFCCIHRQLPTLKMCSRCRHRKEVMLK